MCTRRLASLALALICLLTLTLGVAHGQATPPAPAAEPGRGSAIGPAAPSASYAPAMPPSPIRPLMTYQGRLTENGAPVTGVREMTFRLCAANTPGTTCGTVWTEGPKSITVTNGLFTTMLGDTVSLPVSSFPYGVTLEVQVGSQILPRQTLGGAPYAMSLAPGSGIYGMLSEPTPLLNIYNYSGRALNASGFGIAVHADSVTGRAIDATSSSEGWENATLYVRNTSSNGGAAANIAGQGLPPALILQNSYPGNGSSGAALYAETNGGPVILGVNTGGAGVVFSVQGNGDIHQVQTADGAVKAAVDAWCASSGAVVNRSFGPPSSNILVNGGGSPGQCVFDFGFKISDRFFTVTALSSQPLVVNCIIPAFHDPNLQCQVTNLAGAGVNSEIMIVIY
jgi:hypothetical protein